MASSVRPVVLCILDGWGLSEKAEHNAIAQANTPQWDALQARFGMTSLDASEEHVGLPPGQMGNSEVGHMNIGAGRVVQQELGRIDSAIADGTLAKNWRLQKLIDEQTDSGRPVHLLGLLSDGGVHSHQNHLEALARILSDAGIHVCLHAFLDGRDTSPKSAASYLKHWQASFAGNPLVTISTIAGRYYAMDRDKRWDRVALAYKAIVNAEAEHFGTVEEALADAYAKGATDEFVTPRTIGEVHHGILPGDALLMGNFRADRARQLLHALLDPEYTSFDRPHPPEFASAVGMVEYSSELSEMIPPLFPQTLPMNTLGEIVSKAGLKQLRIAETEKYAHVTFFFSGGREEIFPGEERILIPSPSVATYDLKPEMSAYELTDRLVAAIETGTYDFIAVNYANTDMVGHSGNLAATIQAVEAVDLCLGRLWHAVEHAGGALFVTADHGNAEKMHDDARAEAHTAHTTNRVPALLAVANARSAPRLSPGKLADIAPTLAALLQIPVPAEMTGRALLSLDDAKSA